MVTSRVTVFPLAVGKKEEQFLLESSRNGLLSNGAMFDIMNHSEPGWRV